MRGWSISVVTGDNFLAPLHPACSLVSSAIPSCGDLCITRPKGKESHPLLGERAGVRGFLAFLVA